MAGYWPRCVFIPVHGARKQSRAMNIKHARKG